MNLFARALLALALLLPQAAFAAATPESRVEAERLLQTLDMQKTLDEAIRVNLDAQVKAQPELAPFRQVMLDFFSKYMSYESLKPQLVETYAEAFTAKELQEIRVFNESPTGRKAMQLLPTLMAKGAEIGQKQVEAHLPELLKMVRDEAEKLKQQEAAPAAKKP
jgi:hypothetical protein